MINFMKKTLVSLKNETSKAKAKAKATQPQITPEKFESAIEHTSHLRHQNNEWTTEIHVTEVFGAFKPYSSGDYTTKADLTLDTINKIPECFERLLNNLGNKSPDIKKTSEIVLSSEQGTLAENLKRELDRHGSDKANSHDYHLVYSQIIGTPEKVENIFEIGLGTNNEDVVSNMGAQGRPGASLRALKAYCKNASIYGADIDTRILFEEERIKTFYIDQKSPASFEKILPLIPSQKFDLVIDDGLHSPDANINSLIFGLQLIKELGWVVVEDINPTALNIWKCVGAALHSTHNCCIYQASGGLLFAAQKKPT